MTLTEPVLKKRQVLARAVLEATTGVTFQPVRQPRPWNAPRWTKGDANVEACDLLFLPLPLDPLPEDVQDPLAVALAFAASKIPVIIPSGNKGTSRLSYLAQPATHLIEPAPQDSLAELFDLDEAAIHAVFGDGTSKATDATFYRALIERLKGARAICVGACNDQGVRSRYSQYGEGLTLVAPSDDVLPLQHEQDAGARLPPTIATTDLRGFAGYQQDNSDYTLSDNVAGFGGTSAAGAQVAGVVVLMLQAKPDLGPIRVREILEETAWQPDGGGYSVELGHGLVDAGAAVAKAAASSG